jgi:hypothetical protein
MMDLIVRSFDIPVRQVHIKVNHPKKNKINKWDEMKRK